MNEHTTPEQDVVSLRLWLRLLTCTRLVETRLRTALRKEHDITLPRFDVMAQLERCYPEGLRMGDLSHMLVVTGGNVTGIVEQLVTEGLVERTIGPGDRRVNRVRLTTTGVETFRAMAAEHRHQVGELFACLDSDEQKQMIALLDTLKNALRPEKA